MKHLYIVRSAGLGGIFCNFCNNHVVLLILFDTLVKCLSNVNLLSNVNPKWFCDDAWETLLLLKCIVGWQIIFSFLEKITSWACLLGSGLKLIFHWKVHCFILKISLLSSKVVITVSWITKKRDVSSCKSLVLEDKSSAKLLIYNKNNNGLRMEHWGTPALTLVHEEDCPFNTTLCFLFVKKLSKLLISYPIFHFLVIWI